MDNNTELFYEEIKSNDEPDMYKLFQLSKQKLFLREPLCKYNKTKYQKFVVRISVNSDQLFMVTCFKQYNEFLRVMEKSSVWNLVIINKFILSQLIKENNVTMIHKISKEWDPTLYLYYLYKYGLISFELFNVLKPDILNEDTLIAIYALDYFYFNKKKDFGKLFNYIEKSVVINGILNHYGRDIAILRYVTNHFLDDSLFPNGIVTDKDLPINFDNKDLFYIKDQQEEDIKNQWRNSSYTRYKAMHHDQLESMEKEFRENGDLFKNAYLNSPESIDKILHNPAYILDQTLKNKEVTINYSIKMMICLCYLVSLIHQEECSPFLQSLITSILEKHHHLHLQINHKKIIFNHPPVEPSESSSTEEAFHPESMLYELFKNTPNDTFNYYF